MQFSVLPCKRMNRPVFRWYYMTKIDSIISDYTYLKGKYDYTLNEINNSFPKDIRCVNKEMLQQSRSSY